MLPHMGFVAGGSCCSQAGQLGADGMHCWQTLLH